MFPADPPTPHRPALLGLALSLLVASLGNSIANIALPGLAVAFEVPFARIRWVVIAYLGALTVCTVLAGQMGDRFGRRRVLLVGLGVFTGASLLCGLSGGLTLLVGARVAQGAGAACLMTLTIALLRDTTPPDRVGRMMGLMGTISAVGTALGPSVGAGLIAGFGWPAVFLALVPLGLLAGVFVLRRLPPDPSRHRPSHLGLAGFRDVNLVPGLIANLLVAGVMMSTLLVGPFYLSLGLGLGDMGVGLVMTIGPVISICCGVLSGRMVDAWGAHPVLLAGLCAMILGAGALALLPGLVGVAGYVAGIVLLTPGYQMFQSANNTAVMSNAAPARRGLLSGVLALSRNLGLIFGATALGAVFAYGTGPVTDATPQALGDGLRLTFLLAAGLMGGALVLCRRRGAQPTQI